MELPRGPSPSAFASEAKESPSPRAGPSPGPLRNRRGPTCHITSGRPPQIRSSRVRRVRRVSEPCSPQAPSAGKRHSRGATGQQRPNTAKARGCRAAVRNNRRAGPQMFTSPRPAAAPPPETWPATSQHQRRGASSASRAENRSEPTPQPHAASRRRAAEPPLAQNQEQMGQMGAPEVHSVHPGQ
ncbi:hypothetical protein NDU88_002223 [Pleurodeles waltl]|uniref:Uncharacterized protein n=1 Tax=Pleurodeles waltl TaxID=8319 RepID=A0AAV7T1S2_PLEWA|nr:hypothetical protein NDU88_002223 [Pleurodeles waltl]